MAAVLQEINLHDPDASDYLYNEAIKKLRANIQFSGRRNKVIMFTSVFEGEGKSDVTFHTAVEMAKMGRRVLLIDADIRNSQFVSRYQIEGRTKGLSDFLSGDAESVSDIMYATNYPNLFMILAGTYVANPSEMLGDEVFKRLLDWARSVYDYVFIDTPPLGVVIDAAMIGRFCDGAIIVIESGAVSYRAALKVKQQLEMANTRILGVVLNKIDRKDDEKYGRYGKYGKYGHYGRYGKYGYGYGYGERQQHEEDVKNGVNVYEK